MIIRIPNNNLLKEIKKTDKNLINKDSRSIFLKNLEYFKTQEFWKKDRSYKSIQSWLTNLSKSKISLIDVGCYVGSLPIFLNKIGIWDQIDYTGADIIEECLAIIKKEFPEGKYIAADAHNIQVAEEYDVVYTKGTIISTHFPDQSLESILKINCKHAILAHQPLIKRKKERKKENYENILIVKEDDMYTSTVLYEDFFFDKIKELGFEIVEKKKHPISIRLKNFDNYYLYDFLLKKI